jgi:hypothetical protein
MRQNERVREVVQKLGTLVKEGCVIFVAFDNECARGTKLKTAAEVFCNAADQE